MSEPSAPPRVGGRMSDRRRELQRLQISREAVGLFRAQGVAATSGEQIAEAVGLSARTLWRYFRSKESCVEPLLSFAIDGLVTRLRRWPPDRSLEEHLALDRSAADAAALPGDSEAALAVIAMARTEPDLRAIWLVLYERSVPVLAEVLAGRLGRSADDLAIRVQAAALAAALRIATEDAAADFAEGRTIRREGAEARLAEAVRAATHGVGSLAPAG